MSLKKLLLILPLLSLLSAPAYAVTNLITNYVQLVQTLESGEDVKAIIHFDKCLLTNPTNQQFLYQTLAGSSTRINFNQYLHFKPRINGQLKDMVLISSRNVIQNSSGIDYIVLSQLNIFEEEPAIFNVTLFNTISKAQTQYSWQCYINRGEDQNGLTLYNFP